jgi:hypothetical protein
MCRLNQARRINPGDPVQRHVHVPVRPNDVVRPPERPRIQFRLATFGNPAPQSFHWQRPDAVPCHPVTRMATEMKVPVLRIAGIAHRSKHRPAFHRLFGLHRDPVQMCIQSEETVRMVHPHRVPPTLPGEKSVVGIGKDVTHPPGMGRTNHGVQFCRANKVERVPAVPRTVGVAWHSCRRLVGLRTEHRRAAGKRQFQPWLRRDAHLLHALVLLCMVGQSSPRPFMGNKCLGMSILADHFSPPPHPARRFYQGKKPEARRNQLPFSL